MIAVLVIEHNQVRHSCQGWALQIDFNLLQTAHPPDHEVSIATVSEVRESTLEGRAPKKLPKGVKVIDVDVHAHETPAALISYCEMPWRKSLELISKVPERYLDIPFFAPQMAVWSPPFPQSASERRQVVASASQMRKDLDELGIAIGVIFPD